MCLLTCLRYLLVLVALAIACAVGSDFHDFSQEWTSARNLLEGRPIYADFGESLEYHFGRKVSVHFRYNAHPPASVLLALPFASLPYQQSFLAWTSVSLLSLAISLWLLVKGGATRPGELSALVLLTFILTSSALREQVIQGQLNLFLLVLLTGAWFSVRRCRFSIAGVLIGIAAAIKVFPAFLVLIPLAERKWAGIKGFFIGFLSANGLAFLVLGGQAYLDYFLIVAPDVAKFRDTWPNASLLGFWSKLFDGGFGQVNPVWQAPILAKCLAGVSGLAITAFTYWAGVTVHRRASAPASLVNTGQDLVYALACAGMLLASPITWDHYFLLLLPGLWLAWRACSGRMFWQGMIAACGIATVWISPFSLWRTMMPEHFGPRGQPLPAGPAYVLTLLSFQFYALLAFYLLTCVRLFRWRSSDWPGPSTNS